MPRSFAQHAERVFWVLLIPLSIAGSAVGLWASAMALLQDLSGGEGWGDH
jgi:hypothetical protein